MNKNQIITTLLGSFAKGFCFGLAFGWVSEGFQSGLIIGCIVAVLFTLAQGIILVVNKKKQEKSPEEK